MDYQRIFDLLVSYLPLMQRDLKDEHGNENTGPHQIGDPQYLHMDLSRETPWQAWYSFLRALHWLVPIMGSYQYWSTRQAEHAARTPLPLLFNRLTIASITIGRQFTPRFWEDAQKMRDVFDTKDGQACLGLVNDALGEQGRFIPSIWQDGRIYYYPGRSSMTLAALKELTYPVHPTYTKEIDIEYLNDLIRVMRESLELYALSMKGNHQTKFINGFGKKSDLKKAQKYTDESVAKIASLLDAAERGIPTWKNSTERYT